MIDSRAGQNFIFFCIDVAVHEGYVNQSLIQEFCYGRPVTTGDVKMKIRILCLQSTGCLHDDADTV